MPSERGRSPARPEQGHDTHLRAYSCDPVQLPGELGEQHGQLRAEGRGNRLLRVGPGREDRVAVLPDDGSHRLVKLRHQFVEAVQGRAQLQREPGVHDVLCGGPVVDPAGRTVRKRRGDHLHQRQYWVADVARLAPELVQIDVSQNRRSGDRLGILGRQYPYPSLSPGQRALGLQPTLDRSFFGEDA